jgi:hypothetical protein
MNATKGLNIVAVAISTFFLVLHYLLISQKHHAIPGLIPSFLAALLVVLGYAIKGIEPNPFIGIRVPWTMKSPMVWRKTHERASKLWMIGGLIGFCSSLVGGPILLPILIFIACVLYPVFDSYKLSKVG